MKFALPVVCLFCMAPLTVEAADVSPYGELSVAKAPEPLVDLSSYEFRLGGYAHDPLSPEKGSVDLNGEVLFAKLNFLPAQTWDMFIPRPHFGGTINFVGKTSNLYTGLTWDFNVYQNFFVEGTFGEAVNNGKIGDVDLPHGHNPMGCNWSFHESGSIGYHINEAWSVLATIEHFSNAGLCDENRGLTNYGARIGRSF